MTSPPSTEQTAPLIIYALFALNGIGWGITFLFVKSWMKDVRTGIKEIRDSLADKQSTAGCEVLMGKLEEQIARDSAKNCADHGNMWDRVNSHGHEGKCVKFGDVCSVEVGRVIIGHGGRK